MLFLFWRVPPPFRNGEVDAPHTLIHSFFENIPYQLINRLRIHWVVKRFKGVYNIIALIIFGNLTSIALTGIGIMN